MPLWPRFPAEACCAVLGSQAAQLAAWGAEGVIVGSALVRALGEAATPVRLYTLKAHLPHGAHLHRAQTLFDLSMLCLTSIWPFFHAAYRTSGFCESRAPPAVIVADRRTVAGPWGRS